MTENTDVGPLLYLYSYLWWSSSFKSWNIINSFNTKYSTDTCLSLGSLKNKGWGKDLNADSLRNDLREQWENEIRRKSQYKKWYIIKVIPKDNWGSFHLNSLRQVHRRSHNCLPIGWEASCYPSAPVSH